jgi:two-component system response regulator PilR (NtrC family)
MARVLVVDDDKGMREVLEIMLSKEGYQVTSAPGGREALSICQKSKFDVVITDLKMPRVDGIDVLKGIKESSPETMVVLVTAYASGETAVAAMREGAYDYLEKNFDIEELKLTVRDALRRKGVEQGSEISFNASLDGAVSFENMIAKSKEMLKVFALIRKVANTPANVLILGESGTGKELVARAIHDNSERKGKAFVAINCGGIPETLLESELFGYMKGAFTGAYADRPGLFEVARGGTIFLDEIGELPVILQVKLLRVVQEKTFRRVGGSEDIKVDVRIISATNQDLSQKVKDGAFREDLFYRLNVIPIQMPPLRKRKEDIPILARYFIEKYSRQFGKEIRKISSYALELLMEYQFPGNVRELENIIERSVAMEQSNIILPENLVLSGGSKEEINRPFDLELPDEGIHLDAEMARLEKQLIEKALQKAKGTKTKAAQLLNMTRDALNYRIEKLDIRE